METPPIPGVEFRREKKWPYANVAAIVFEPVDADTKARILGALPAGVKHNILLAKKWKVWAVYASETWAFEHRDAPPPKRGARSAERGTENTKPATPWLETLNTPAIQIGPAS